MSESPSILNESLYVAISVGKGRAVYAKNDITKIGTIVDVSPLLLFSSDEYQTHGKYTVLDHYTYKLRDGRLALALGLGSLFNHADPPNLKYTIDYLTESIRYETTRCIRQGEELTIWYGPAEKLWFETLESKQSWHTPGSTFQLSADSAFQDCTELPIDSFLSTSSDINPHVPFLMHSAENDWTGEIITKQAWVADVPDVRQLSSLLKWVTASFVNTHDLTHLRRVRKQGGTTTLLLTSQPEKPESPPPDLSLVQLRQVTVPIISTRSNEEARAAATIWPVIFAPRRDVDPHSDWSTEKLEWAFHAMKAAIQEARKVATHGELPIAAHIPIAFSEEVPYTKAFTSSDTRNQTHHPLKHAVLNIIRKVANYLETTPVRQSKNGSHYLLTGASLFTTHEPCIMCSMALLHSRVKEVFYLIPMPKTGGCGGVTTLPRLDGVNHRFQIYQWAADSKLYGFDVNTVHVDPDTDA